MDSSRRRCSNHEEDFINQIRAPKQRVFKNREDFLTVLDENDFLSRFRLSKASFLVLLEMIRTKISPISKRSHAISAESKLFAALRFYATGSFLMTVGDTVGLSSQSMSKVIKEVSEAIVSLKNEFIFMPRNRDEILNAHRKFYETASFPTVVGAIDTMHVKIKGQRGNDGEVFRNRKKFISINVQSVAGADLKFQDIVAQWPGSTEDSYIFNQSHVKKRFEDGEFGFGVLLGDGDYELYPFLMTPFRTPSNQKEILYNRVQILTKNTVERKYEVRKRRFPCLVFGLRCNLETSLAVIIACIAQLLHRTKG